MRWLEMYVILFWVERFAHRQMLRKWEKKQQASNLDEQSYLVTAQGQI